MTNETTRVTVPLEAFLATYEPPCGHPDWDDVVRWATGSPYDAEVVNHLLGVLQSGATFREPVAVDIETRTAVNGRHRVAAHILHGSPTITFKASGTSNGYPVHEVVFSTTSDVFNDPDFTLMSAIRSFPLDTETWAETDGLSSEGGGVYHTLLYCPADRVEHWEQAATARLATAGVEWTVHAIGPWALEHVDVDSPVEEWPPTLSDQVVAALKAAGTFPVT